ncbi:hypothetical protein L0U85_05470 [Glycomyces sp. L485]|uniref:hypothetical protein n=1 Tax=Glycomyces sp. L485 TaxID=2909235 RepID=UPI001F4A531C|nr:hypothetical protein [Glycomyces sp. L485]MCH7230307.1 hypothetical protein [Glycomyces sp. L485]
MTTRNQLRKAVLALPETEEAAHAAMPAFSVRGKGFASLPEDGWVQLRLPPERVVAAVDQAEATEPGEGDLPAGIGRPATRALRGAGLATLDLVAAKSEAELLELHSVGPKTVRILKQALAEQERSLRR